MYSYFVFKNVFTFLGIITVCFYWKLVTRITDQAASFNDASSVWRKLHQFRYSFDYLIQEVGYLQMENNARERVVPDASGPQIQRIESKFLWDFRWDWLWSGLQWDVEFSLLILVQCLWELFHCLPSVYWIFSLQSFKKYNNVIWKC